MDLKGSFFTIKFVSGKKNHLSDGWRANPGISFYDLTAGRASQEYLFTGVRGCV
jgi:hypothetical protein